MTPRRRQDFPLFSRRFWHFRPIDNGQISTVWFLDDGSHPKRLAVAAFRGSSNLPYSRRKTMASFAPSLTLAISLHDAHMRHGRLLAISAVEQCDSKRLELVMALKAE